MRKSQVNRLCFCFIVHASRKERLEVNEKFFKLYNNGDFDEFYSFLNAYCDPQVQFLTPKLTTSAFGVLPILTYFLVLSEVFPDSHISNIEKRIASIKAPRSPSFAQNSSSSFQLPNLVETIECIGKFVGTRIFEVAIVPCLESCLNDSLMENPGGTVSDVSQRVITKIHEVKLRQLSNQNLKENTWNDFHTMVTQPNYLQQKINKEIQIGKMCTYIVENDFTFDLTSNRIIQWYCQILAADI